MRGETMKLVNTCICESCYTCSAVKWYVPPMHAL